MMALEAYINWAGNVGRRMLEEGLRSMLRYQSGNVTICAYETFIWLSKTTVPLEVLVGSVSARQRAGPN